MNTEMTYPNAVHFNLIKIESADHHIKAKYCTTRLKYREGKRATSVKAYTINDESKYLLIQGVPKLNLEKELYDLCSKYGPVEMISQAQDYPSLDQFSLAFVIKYKFFNNAKYAKKRLDELNFMGSVLHVCFLPELEDVQETLEKFKERKKAVNMFFQKGSNKKIKLDDKDKLLANQKELKLCQQLLSYTWNQKEYTQDKFNLINQSNLSEINQYQDIRLKIRQKLKTLKRPVTKIDLK